MESIIQPSNIPPVSFVAAQIVVDVVVAAGVFARLVTNYVYTPKLSLDDYFSIVAVAFLAGFSATSSLLNASFFRDQRLVTVSYLTNLSAATIYAGTAAMFFGKIPLLLLLTRVFGIKRWLRYSIYVLIVALALGFVGAVSSTAVHCSPRQDDPGLPFLEECIAGVLATGLARNSISLVADVVIFILPLVLIAPLRLSLQKKIALFGVFFTGALGIIASIISLYFQRAQDSNQTSNFTNALISTDVECAIIVLISCAPAYHLLWTHYLARLLPPKYGTGAEITRSEPRGAISNSVMNTEASKNGGIHVTTHNYIELHDFAGGEVGGYSTTAVAQAR